MDRPSLLQPELTRAVTDDAIYRATFLTDEQRKQEYFEAIVDAARKYPYLSIDQVWETRGSVGDQRRDNGSGMGPMMQVAARAGVIERLPREFRPSQRPLTHGKPQRFWKSLLYAGPPLDDAAIAALKASGMELLKKSEERRRKKRPATAPAPLVSRLKKQKEKNVTVEITLEDLMELQEKASKCEGICNTKLQTTDGETVWLTVQNQRRRVKRPVKAQEPAPAVEMPHTQTA